MQKMNMASQHTVSVYRIFQLVTLATFLEVWLHQLIRSDILLQDQNIFFIKYTIKQRSQGSSVSVVSGYGLDDWAVEV
jgi:hypothetical protein